MARASKSSLQSTIKNGGYVDAGQALQMQVPGLFVAPKNGPFDYVNRLAARRPHAVDVIWLVDGVRISNRLYTTTTPLDTMPASMIEKIEVLKGGQSLFYGTSAVSGAINIVTQGVLEGTSKARSRPASVRTKNATSTATRRDRSATTALSCSPATTQPKASSPSATRTTSRARPDRNRGYDVTNIGAKYGYEFSPGRQGVGKLPAHRRRAGFCQRRTRPTGRTTIATRISCRPSSTGRWATSSAFFAKAYYHWWDTRFTDIRNTEPPVGTLNI